jgi:membrane-associated phospholipid phosphatase
MEAGSLTRRLGGRWPGRRLGGERIRRSLHVLVPAAYLALLLASVARDGVPMARDRLLMWIVFGLLAFSLTNVRGWARGVVLEWLPFALILWAYDLLRGQADGLLFATHFRPQLEADALLFAGTVPTVWLQEHLWHGSWDLRWYDYAAWGVYASYFLATYVVAGLLWRFARTRFRRYVGAVSLLALMGFGTYALFPAAPPWLASREGELDWTTRTIGLVSREVPITSFETLFERGSEYANPVAAVPSLHAAYTLLITLFLWSVARRARPLLAAYPVAMAFALVYTAEHYVVDILLGWLYALVAVWAVHRVADRWSQRRARGEARPAGRVVGRAELERPAGARISRDPARAAGIPPP